MTENEKLQRKVKRLKKAAKFAQEAIRQNIVRYYYKDEQILYAGFEELRKALNYRPR